MKTKIQSNVVAMPQKTDTTVWLADIDAHAKMVASHRKISADKKSVSMVLQTIKNAADKAIANLECAKLPANTKARLMLKNALNKHAGKQVCPFEMLEGEIAFLDRRRATKRKKIDQLETKILMVEPQNQNEVSVLLGFLATLLREGRPVAKGYLADIIEDCTVRLPSAQAKKSSAFSTATLAKAQGHHSAGHV